MPEIGGDRRHCEPLLAIRRRQYFGRRSSLVRRQRYWHRSVVISRREWLLEGGLPMQDAKPGAGGSDLAGGGFTSAGQTESKAGSTAEGDAASLAVGQPPAQAPEASSTPTSAVAAAPPAVASDGKPGGPSPPAPQPISEFATSSPTAPALAAAPAGFTADGKPVVPPPAAQAAGATGFKAMTVGQIWEYVEAAAKFSEVCT